MEKRLIISFSLITISFLSLWAQDGKYSATYKKLEEIKRQLSEKSKEYDDYMKKYNEALETMRKLKITQADYTLKKKEYENLIESINRKILENRRQYEMLMKLQKEISDDAGVDFRKLYLSRFSTSFFYGRYDIIKDMIIRNMIIERKKMVDSIKGKKRIFMEGIMNLSKKNEIIAKRKTETEVAIKRGFEMIRKKERDLHITDEKLKRIRDEIDELNRTAKELTQLIKEIEKRSPYKKDYISSISIEKKSLPWPCIGSVVSRFGKEYVEELKTWIVNDGIKIKTNSVSSVRAVMKGRVVYSGRFRGYGNIVIVEHDDGIFTTYGFLSEVYVKSGDEVSDISEIGKTGKDERGFDTDNSTILYFEIRKGDTPLDPLIYLK
ncbi:MAG: murein hydrolase activator EnvC family protein [Elusimicrobiales bacterium]